MKSSITIPTWVAFLWGPFHVWAGVMVYKLGKQSVVDLRERLAPDKSAD